MSAGACQYEQDAPELKEAGAVFVRQEAAWEMLVHQLAIKAGLQVADAGLPSVKG